MTPPLAQLPPPYYDREGITIYCADCRDILPLLEADVMVTDPPYGISYKSGHDGVLARSIQGDEDTTLREFALEVWGPRPALVFGTWKVTAPAETRQVLIWDTLGALGMGALDLPWKPSHQQIYVLGKGFHGRRTSDVLSFPPVQSSAWRGRCHPHQKPVELMRALIRKCPEGVILDPFCGSGTTLRAAKDLGKEAIGIEIDQENIEIAVKRLAQEVLAL